MRLLGRGRLPHSGVHPPEAALAADDLRGELERVGTVFELHTNSEVPAS